MKPGIEVTKAVARRLLSQLTLHGASACVLVSFYVSVQPSVSRSPYYWIRSRPYIGFKAGTTEEGARGRNRVGAAGSPGQGVREAKSGEAGASRAPLVLGTAGTIGKQISVIWNGPRAVVWVG
jgi:hypothetical protein